MRDRTRSGKDVVESRVETLLRSLRGLMKGEVKRAVDSRLKEFKRLRRGSNEEIFKELCFCILTANFSAERSAEIQREVGQGFLTLGVAELAEKLKKLGHRYPNVRAEYIVEARKYVDSLGKTLGDLRGEERREWLVKNVRGLGYKEASHFLRNMGFTDFAILDFHVLDLLREYGVIDRCGPLRKRRYLEIENSLRKIGEKLGLNLAELDLYLWYMKTGRIVK